MADRIALYLQDNYSLQDAIKYVQYAELRGFEAVWQAESRLARDAIVPMAAFAATTTRIKIGSAVINTWTRNAALIAATFLTLDDLAPDRILLGLGSWYEPLARMTGINRQKPLLAMREVVQTVRALLAGQRVTYRGEFVQMENVSLDVIYGRKEPRMVPLYIATTGPKMAALGGEIGDGILLNHLVAPVQNAQIISEMERGLHKAGRRPESIDRPQLIVCSVDRDREKALNRARKLVTQSLMQQPQVMKASGIRQELLDEIAQISSWTLDPDAIQEAARLVPDDVVQLVTAAGGPDEVRAKVREYIAHGATSPVLYPLGDDIHYLIDVFADRLTA